MSRWFRHYAGMMRDDKLVRAALRSKQPVERVAWIWGAILESAAEIDDGGRYEIDAAEIAYFLRTDEADIRAILDALAGLQRVAADRVVKWGARQFQSDRSATRQAAYRERKRHEDSHGDIQQASCGGDVTSLSRHSDAPETETETETEAKTKKKEEKQDDSASRPTTRGTRMQPEAKISEQDRQFARQHGLSEPEIEKAWAEFVDYWIAVPGQRGSKLDWPATWRNRVREVFSRRKPKGNGHADDRSVGAVARAAAERYRTLAESDGVCDDDGVPPYRLIPQRTGT